MDQPIEPDQTLRAKTQRPNAIKYFEGIYGEFSLNPRGFIKNVILSARASEKTPEELKLLDPEVAAANTRLVNDVEIPGVHTIKTAIANLFFRVSMILSSSETLGLEIPENVRTYINSINELYFEVFQEVCRETGIPITAKTLKTFIYEYNTAISRNVRWTKAGLKLIPEPAEN